MNPNMDLNLWEPELFFCSHATADNVLASRVERGLKILNPALNLYFAENKYVGVPLIDKLKKELLESNALLVIWTKKAESNISTSQIISFEVGMAYSLGLPIYLLRFQEAGMPWVFEQITDFITVKSEEQPEIDRTITQIDPNSFYHPIDVIIPKEKYDKRNDGTNHSMNLDVISDSGDIILPNQFNGIIHYDIVNNRLSPERSVWISIISSPSIKLNFNQGKLDAETGVHRNDLFHMFRQAQNMITIHWPSLQTGAIRRFEIGLESVDHITNDDYLIFQVSSEHIINQRYRKINIRRSII